MSTNMVMSGRRPMVQSFQPHLRGRVMVNPVSFCAVPGRPGRYFSSMSYGQVICFDSGNIDDYAAVTYFQGEDGTWYRALPYDVYYFEIFLILSEFVGGQKVWGDLRGLFAAMKGHEYKKDDEKRPDVFEKHVRELRNLCVDVSYTYPNDLASAACNALLHFYYGMVAEECKKGAVLKRRIKMSGIALVLFFGWPVDVATEWTVGKPATLLAAIVQQPFVGLEPDWSYERMTAAECRDEIVGYEARCAVEKRVPWPDGCRRPYVEM